MKTFTAYVEFMPESPPYAVTVPDPAGAHPQAAPLEELREHLREVIELRLEEYDGPTEDLPAHE